jgi:hypothetical protein
MPLNPYLKGKMIAYLRKELKLTEIGLVPDELCFDGEIEFHERTIVLNWMKQWLKWVIRYYTDAWSPEVSIDQMFSAPMCATNWKRLHFDENLFFFGLFWKLYDMAAGWSMSTTPNWLLDPNTTVTHDRWIDGGFSGSDFIMAPVILSMTEEKERRL